MAVARGNPARVELDSWRSAIAKMRVEIVSSMAQGKLTAIRLSSADQDAYQLLGADLVKSSNAYATELRKQVRINKSTSGTTAISAWAIQAPVEK